VYGVVVYIGLFVGEDIWVSYCCRGWFGSVNLVGGKEG
jgi:hypothetical protein